ncbi:MAG: heavy-metal-associated domain-containing protein [Steroidobacteraceae bacterium]
MRSVVLQIRGMHCDGCANSVKALLEREPGVKSAAVAFESGAARVLFDPLKIEEKRLLAVLVQLGYAAVVRRLA